jgi:AdoMet-dependent heme synthase
MKKIKIKVSSVNLALTNRCNSRCKHCYFDSGKSLPYEMKAKQIKKALDELKKIGVKKIDITGGEPLLRDDLEEIISYAKKQDFYVKVLTNGLLLSKEKLALLKKAGLDAIGISLDGSTPEIYNSVRNMNEKVFNSVIKNIKNTVSFGFYVKVNTVALDLNIDDLVNISELCRKLKVNEHRICYFTPKGRGKNLSGPDPIKWHQFVVGNLKQTDSFVGFSLIEDRFLKCDC